MADFWGFVKNNLCTKKRWFFCARGVVFGICILTNAHAATCDAGYYLNNGECDICNWDSDLVHKSDYYCPGDDMRYICPVKGAGVNTRAYYPDYKYLHDVSSFARTSRANAESITECWYTLVVASDTTYYNSRLVYSDIEQKYILQEISRMDLSGYTMVCNGTGTTPRCNAPVRCTDMPDKNAHYTGNVGLTGNAIDVPRKCWECDEGFGHTSDDRCLPLCRIGETAMNGINIYAEKHTKYAMAVPRNGGVCWISATRGQGGKLVPVN